MALSRASVLPYRIRSRRSFRPFRWLTLGLLLALTAVSGQWPSQEYRLFQATRPYQFDVVGWMMGAAIGQLFSPRVSMASNQKALEGFAQLVTELGVARNQLDRAVASGHEADPLTYQRRVEQLESELRRRAPEVQAILGSAVASQFLEQGIGDNFLGLRPFPPVIFRMEELPEVLIVSPRNRIQYAGAVLLQPGLTVEQMEQVEARAEALGYSALVVPIGGLGTFPAMVPYSSDLRHLVTTIAHEWTHQYLALKPLGYKYSLGLERDPDVIAINETVADLVGQEIGQRAYQALGYTQVQPQAAVTAPRKANDFDFNAEMRKIRLEVDKLLADGRVREAEAFMEQSREQLVAHGYYIRKLNQAYFAFYGNYADAPYSVSPIGQELRELRSRYNSLAEFLKAVSNFRSHNDLKAALAAGR